jgi:hypothetical protein
MDSLPTQPTTGSLTPRQVPAGPVQRVSAFREGRAVVSSIIGRKSYVIDRDGRPLIELASSIPGDYERFARHNANARFGYIDPEGRTVWHTWLTAQPFSEGLAFVESPTRTPAHARVHGRYRAVGAQRARRHCPDVTVHRRPGAGRPTGAGPLALRLPGPHRRGAHRVRLRRRRAVSGKVSPP